MYGQKSREHNLSCRAAVKSDVARVIDGTGFENEFDAWGGITLLSSPRV